MSEKENIPNGNDISLANILDNDAVVTGQSEDTEMVEDANLDEEKEVPEGFCVECEGKIVIYDYVNTFLMSDQINLQKYFAQRARTIFAKSASRRSTGKAVANDILSNL